MQRLLLVCLGGALGSGARYLVGVLAVRLFGLGFPWGTLFVNLVGCFLMGLIMALGMGLASFPPTLRLALTTGFLGGLMTYSSFNFETTWLALDGALASALVNFGVTALGGLLAGLGGLALGRMFVPG